MTDSELFTQRATQLRRLVWVGCIFSVFVLLGNLYGDSGVHAYKELIYTGPSFALGLTLLLAIMIRQNWARRLWIVLFALSLPFIPITIKMEPFYASYPGLSRTSLTIIQAYIALLLLGVIFAVLLLIPRYRALFTPLPPNQVRQISLSVFSACFLGLGIVASSQIRISTDTASKRIWLDLPNSKLFQFLHLVKQPLPPAQLVRVDAPMDYNWKVETLDGSPVQMTGFQGKVLFINMWATWCAPCIAELESIDRLAAHFSDQKDLAFFIVSEEDPSVVREFLKQHPHKLPIYVAPQGRPPVLISAAYPVSFIVSKSGRIVASKEQPSVWDSNETIQLFDALLAEIPGVSHSPALEKLPAGELPNKSPRLRTNPYYPPAVWRLRAESFALVNQGKFPEAERAIRKNLVIFEKDGADTMDVAGSLAYLGVVVEKQGRLHEAEEFQKRALDIAEGHYGWTWSGLVPYLNFLGETYFQESKFDEAAKAHREAIALAKGDPKQKGALPQLLRALAKDERQMGHAADAQAHEQEADQLEKGF